MKEFRFHYCYCNTTLTRQDTDTTPKTLLSRDKILTPLLGHYYHKTGYRHHSQDTTITRRDTDTTPRTLLSQDGILTPLPGHYYHKTGYWHHSQDTTITRQDTDTTSRTVLSRDRIYGLQYTHIHLCVFVGFNIISNFSMRGRGSLKI